MKFRLVEDFDDLLLEGRKSVIEPGSEVEKNLIYDIENTDISFKELAERYGLTSRDPIYTLIKNKKLNPMPRLQGQPKIKSGSELEKALVYDIENTDIPYVELVKKYGLDTTTPIFSLIKRLHLNPIFRPSSTPKIKPGSELEKAIIYDIQHIGKSFEQISKEYGISPSAVYSFAHRKNLKAKKMPKPGPKKMIRVYFNTLEADVHEVRANGIRANMKFLPSIYIGEYSFGTVQNMYRYIRDKYLKGETYTDRIIEFYLKIASKEISLNTLITEMKAQSPIVTSGYNSNIDYKFITVSTEELSTVDFYSANYPQLAKDILTLFSRKDSSSNDFDTVYKDLRAAAAKLDSKTSDLINRITTYISNNLEKIAHNIYSKKGDILEPTNYINGIPYETSFDVNSLQDIASCMNQYKGYLLYGFMDKTGDIVYIGISIYAESRGSFYSKENRPLILKAFEDNIIKKLIIFKSNLPIQSRSVNIKLTYALEVYFAEQLFKTYPANYPKALNKDKPGQNTSKIIASQKGMDLDTYLSDQDKLLSPEEYRSAVKEIGANPQKYPYYEYAKKYIAEHDTDLSFEDKKNLYMGLIGKYKELLWDHCSSESEYRGLIPKDHGRVRIQEFVNAWKNYRIENNLPITEDLDDDIDMEYYV